MQLNSDCGMPRLGLEIENYLPAEWVEAAIKAVGSP
jgi:hypothetical protein